MTQASGGELVENHLPSIVNPMYGVKPSTPLFHYTSIGGALKIVESRVLFATDLRYMSDASELTSSANLMARLCDERSAAGDREVLKQLGKWVRERFARRYNLFVSCFTEKGNLLSQWRGYCPNGKGLSLGFDPEDLWNAAAAQNFLLVRCTYGDKEKYHTMSSVVAAVERCAICTGKDLERPEDECYYAVFEALESVLLRLAVAFKEVAFSEEREWRVVSPKSVPISALKFREGQSMIVPYVDFHLPQADGKLLLTRAVVGPTPHPELAESSVRSLLADRTQGGPLVHRSHIPYRTW